ncbi:MAG: hypothetical protein ACON4P_00115 [Candidatus Puniceispirillales bacterium]
MRLIAYFLFCLIFSIGFASASAWDAENQIKGDKDHFPPCGYGKDTNGPKIGLIGDSWLDYGSGWCGGAEQFFSSITNSRSFFNAAKGGAWITGTKKKDIQKQVLPGKPDILIMSGGGNDLAKCGSNKLCLNKTLNKIISADASEGALLDLIKKWSHDKTKVVYIFSSDLPYAPKKLKKVLATGILDELAARLIHYDQMSAHFKAIDLNAIADVKDRSLWTKDGFHFSPASYHFFSEASRLFLMPHQAQTTETALSNPDSQEDKLCSYAIDKSGLDDKGKPYKGRYSMGSVIIQAADTSGDRRISFDKMEGFGKQEKISFSTRLWFDANNQLNGWFTPYTSKKAKHQAFVTTDGPTYRVVEKVSDYEGVYSFPDNHPKWQNNYEFLVFDCSGEPSETQGSNYIEIDAIDINGQMNESHNIPIKLQIKTGIPDGEGPFPTVVILHGSGNMQDTDAELGQYLVDQGIAWIGVYSYNSRGLKWLTYKERLTKSNIFDQVSDAYRVLHFIESDPRFDENKVAVTGFSLGGMSSLMTASQSLTEKFKIGKKDFVFALNQYGPCFVSPADPKADYKVFNLWGTDDLSTPEKLCMKHMEYQHDKGLDSDHEFIKDVAHGWFRVNDSIVISSESHFSCFIEMTANEIRLQNKSYTNKDEAHLMKAIQKPCKHREGIKNQRSVLAQERAVELLINALK